jgi:hypothetical protein
VPVPFGSQNYTLPSGATANIICTYHTPSTNPTPKPGAWASMSIGVLGLMALGLRARKKNLQFSLPLRSLLAASLPSCRFAPFLPLRPLSTENSGVERNFCLSTKS